MTRILITLSPEADQESVVTELSDLGLGTVTPPAPELPDVAIAEEAAVDSVCQVK